MKKTACFMAVLVIAVVAFSGCTTAPATAGPASISNPAQLQSAPAVQYPAPAMVGSGGYIAKDQPPIGMRTVRTGIRPDGTFTDNDAEMLRIGGVKFVIWGLPDSPPYPRKPAALQKWSCGGLTVYTAFFECKETMFKTLADPNIKAIVARWRATLDSTPPVADPSRPGATQVYMDLPY